MSREREGAGEVEGVRKLGQCLAEWRCEMRKYAKWRMQMQMGMGAGKVTLGLVLGLGGRCRWCRGWAWAKLKEAKRVNSNEQASD